MKETIFFAYPMDEFDRDAKTEDIIAAYNSDENDSKRLPVLKLTPDELTEKINDDMFDDQNYFIRAAKEETTSKEDQADELRNEIVDEIIFTLKKEGLDSIRFSEALEDYTNTIWFDRHDFPCWSRITGIKVVETGLMIHCGDEDISIYTDSDWGARNISTLCDILYVVKETISKSPTLQMCVMMGKLMDSKGMKIIEFVDEPSICLQGKRKTVRTLSINPEGTEIRIKTDTDAYCFDIVPTEDTTMAFLENMLREMDMESLLGFAYYKIPDTPDPDFHSFINNSITWL